jgi:hypothetical protein
MEDIEIPPVAETPKFDFTTADAVSLGLTVGVMYFQALPFVVIVSEPLVLENDQAALFLPGLLSVLLTLKLWSMLR